VGNGHDVDERFVSSHGIVVKLPHEFVTPTVDEDGIQDDGIAMTPLRDRARARRPPAAIVRWVPWEPGKTTVRAMGRRRNHRTKPSRGPPFQPVLEATSFAGLAAEPESWANAAMVASAVIAGDRCFNIDTGSWTFLASRFKLVCTRRGGTDIGRSIIDRFTLSKEGKDVLAVWGIWVATTQGRDRSAGLDDGGGRPSLLLPSSQEDVRGIGGPESQQEEAVTSFSLGRGQWTAVSETLARTRARDELPSRLSLPSPPLPQPSSFP
jgi:hypothetical protein